jgi:hypothetical protein
MTDQPVDVRELAIAAAAACPPRRSGESWLLDLADVANAVLSAVSPVIRQQVAEGVAKKIDDENDDPDDLDPVEVGYSRGLRQAAAIARSHAHPQEPSDAA